MQCYVIAWLLLQFVAYSYGYYIMPSKVDSFLFPATCMDFQKIHFQVSPYQYYSELRVITNYYKM